MSLSKIACVALGAGFFGLIIAALYWDARLDASLQERYVGSVTSLHLDLAATVLAVNSSNLTVLWSTSSGVAISTISSSDFEALIAK